MTQEQINYMKEKLIKLKKEDMSGKMTMGEYLTEIILISNIYVQEVNKAIFAIKRCYRANCGCSITLFGKNNENTNECRGYRYCRKNRKINGIIFCNEKRKKKRRLVKASSL